MHLADRIEMNTAVMRGKPVIRGTQIQWFTSEGR
jgi:uncharacterized protein (DUF433 family)